MKKKVLVGATNFSATCREAKELLEKNGFIVDENPHQRPYTREELKEIVGDYAAVSAGMESWDREILSLAKNLKVIGRFGVGYDNIDLKAAEELGITVAIAKGINGAAVATMAIGLMISVLRKIPMFDRTTREGQWVRAMGSDLDGKKVGLLGFGDIAQKTAKRLSGFDVEILAYDLFPNEEAARSLNVKLTDKDTLLRECDIISCHLPNLPETRHTMNEAAFARMKPTAIFINTSRGPLVDEAALYQALKEGVIAGAGIDVYEQEPIRPDNPLLTLDNIVCTPHTSAETNEVCARVGLNTAQNIVDYFNGKNPFYTITRKPFDEA
jgi:D-3-phosphoglycerate dehydrogenase